MPITFTPAQIQKFAEIQKRMRGTWSWKEKRFILPRMCYATAKWTGFFPKMYVGTRIPYFPIPHISSPEVRIVSKDHWMVAILKQDKEWERLNS